MHIFKVECLNLPICIKTYYKKLGQNLIGIPIAIPIEMQLGFL